MLGSGAGPIPKRFDKGKTHGEHNFHAQPPAALYIGISY